uniref:Signal recognition particle receptor subunit beta n=1 Tax=Panagrolaimus davidi TaxID=227884 RepID=A0A914PUM9_9BILA
MATGKNGSSAAVESRRRSPSERSREIEGSFSCCSKEDNSLAKTEKSIFDALEHEFGLINISRAAALSSTDGRDGGKLLTFSGGDFSWTDIKMDDLNFIPTSAIETDEFDLKNVREWVDSH